ncbi:MAG: hypothetical protein QM640_10455 [Niabella sp.]
MNTLSGIAPAAFQFAAVGCSKKIKDTIQPAIVGGYSYTHTRDNN